VARVDYGQAIAREAAALAAGARIAGVDAPVPSCPGWDVWELVRHTGTTHRWAATVVERRATGSVPPETGELPAERAAIVDWFEEATARLLDVLAATPPDTEVWSWAEDQHARFWARRMAHETAVHRWDGTAAAGRDTPIDGGLAVDGIDEQLANLPFMTRFRPEVASLRGDGETIHLHATDREGEWLVRLGRDGVEWSREHAKGDVAARGSASDLFLFLVGRVEPGRLEVFGDSSLLDRWQRDFSF
jgi:uncharacterized protein (TIGR03083 family)